MLIVFLSEEGNILATYPATGLVLEHGDIVRIQGTDYIVSHKRFDIATSSIEIFLKNQKG